MRQVVRPAQHQQLRLAQRLVRRQLAAGAAAGQLLVTDLETGYLRRLLTLPVSRAAVVLAPIAVGATVVAAQAVLVLGLGLVLGVRSATGAGGLLVVLALAAGWGLAFGGYFVATGLLAGNAAGAQATVFLFFPLVFIAPTFLPREQLQGWLQAAAAANPTTYVIEAMRSLLVTGWEASQLIPAFVLVAALALIGLIWDTTVARRATTRR